MKAALAIADRAAVLVEGESESWARRATSRAIRWSRRSISAVARRAVVLQLVADGVVIGSVIALGAIGVTLVYSILRFANFAHGGLHSLGRLFRLDGAPRHRGGAGPHGADRPVLLRLAADGRSWRRRS